MAAIPFGTRRADRLRDMTTHDDLRTDPDPAASTVLGGRIDAEPLGHTPALDGIRAVAVTAVLLFHGEIVGVDGGFLGVSVFFTLSGFLITSLLLRQWTAHGTLDLRTFWGRRFRRLLPASWFTMALVVLMGALGVWDVEQLRSLRGDVPWALAELINWHFIAQDVSYADAFTLPSPLEHFWSLAIEQQFYLVVPAIVALALLAGAAQPPRRRVRLLVGVLAALTVASAVTNGLLARGSIDRAYFGTDTRAAELLIGALLACALLRRLRLPAGALRLAAVAAGTVGLAAMAVLFHVAELRSAWLYPWGLLLTSVTTVAIITAALQPGVVQRVLESQPLPAIGRISYGVYLLHWPIFLWLTPDRVGWSNAPLFALRIVVTLVAAIAMYHFVESPIRRGELIRTGRARVALPAAAVLLLGATFWTTRDLPDPPEFLQPREPGDLVIREVPTTTTTTTTPPTTVPAPPDEPAPPPPPPPTTAPPVHPQRVLLVGDSVAASIEDALAEALNARGITFASAAAPGCGILTGDPADPQGEPLSITAACSDAIPDLQRSAVAEVGPDLVVALSSWEAGDRVVDGVWHPFYTPEAEFVFRSLVDETYQRLSAGGAPVAILTLPDNVDSRTRAADEEVRRRVEVVNRIYLDMAATHPGRLTTLPLRDIVCPTLPCPTEVEGVTLRPRDGAHFDEPGGARFVAERLADQIAALDLNQI